MFRLIAAALVTGVISVPAVAQPCLGLRTVDDTIEITPESQRYRGEAAVAYGATSRQYLVAWFEDRSEQTGNDVAARFVTSDGEVVGDVQPIVEKPAAQISPAVAWSSTENLFVVTWLTQQSGFFGSAFARVVLADGSMPASDFEASGHGLEGAIAFGASSDANVSSKFLVTGRGAGIGGRFLTSVGALLDPSVTLSQLGSATPNGDLAFDAANQRFLAVWRVQSEPERNIQARIVRLDGSFATNVFVAVQEYPLDMRVAFDSELRRFLIIYNDFDDHSLRGRLIDEKGGAVGDPFTILNESVAGFDVVYNPFGHAFVIACDGEQPFGQNAVIALTVLGDGTVGQDRVTIAATRSFTPFASIALNTDNGECLVVWSEPFANDINRQQIRARRLAFGEPACLAFPGCGAGLCGIGICGGGFAPMMPVTLAAMAWMKRRRGLKVRATL